MNPFEFKNAQWMGLVCFERMVLRSKFSPACAYGLVNRTSPVVFSVPVSGGST